MTSLLLLAALSWLLAPALAPAGETGAGPDPRITAVWGVPAGGAVLSLAGEGFGTADLDVASGAGPNGWIEGNDPGTDFNHLDEAPGWDVGEASQTSPPVITDERAWSGAHSALGRIDYEGRGNWQSAMRYRHDTEFDRIYASWWVYWDPIRVSPHRPTQWKMWRLNHNGNVRDQTGQFIESTRYEQDGTVNTHQAGFFCWLGCPEIRFTDCIASVRPDPAYAPLHSDPANYRYLDRAGATPWEDTLPTPRAWNRVEILVWNSGVDQADGGFTLWITKPGRGRWQIESQTGWRSRGAATGCQNPTDPWRYLILQNYWDDDGSARAELFTGERGDFFYDDLHLQFGSQARVELGNRPDYASCDRLEVQVPESWGDDAIRFTLNPGGFAAGDELFLFVVDAEGNASAGYPVTLK